MPDGPLARQLLDEARSAAGNQQPGRAREKLRRLLLLDPSVAALWVDLAGAAHALGRVVEVTGTLTRASIAADSTGRIQAHAGVLLSRQGHFANAIQPFITAFRLRPRDFHIGTMLAAAQSKAGREQAAFTTLTAIAERARAESDMEALAALADFLYRNGGVTQMARLVPEFASIPIKPDLAGLAVLTLQRSGNLSAGSIGALLDRTDLVTGKAAYYSLAKILSDRWADDHAGTAALLTRLALNPGCIAARRIDEALAGALKTLGAHPPFSAFDDGVKALFEENDAGKSIRIFIQALGDGAYPPAKYNQIIESGDFAGHPLWHLCNPYFPAWYRASSESRDVQANWADDPAIAGAGDEDVHTTYRRWRQTGTPVAPLVRDFVDTVGTTARYLDVGCGIGLWLRFLVEEAGVSLAGLHGTDLHGNRTRAAIRLLARWASVNDQSLDPAGLANRVFPCDVFKNANDLRALLPGGIDAVTLFFVTGCFEDEDLPAFLDGALATRPRHVLHATVADRWTLYRGRPDDERFFEPLGYRLVSRSWAGDPIGPETAERILLPAQYWSNPRVDIFERTDG